MSAQWLVEKSGLWAFCASQEIDWEYWVTLTFGLAFRSLSETLSWTLKSGLRPKFNLTLDLDFRWAKVKK